MGKLKGQNKSVAAWLAKTWLHWLIAVVLFFGLAFYYMGPAITRCSSSSPAIVSDSSGGLAWSQWASGNSLTWDYTYKTNYPVGESLQRPSEVSSETLLIPYRFLSWLTTPTCGLNLLILTGYLSVALTMFGLIRWLFRSSAIAFFAGYAAAFVPYHQLKSESHVTYINNAMFIGIIWAYLWFLNRPSYKKAGLIGLISAFAMYFDGYFILLAGSLVSALVAITLLRPAAASNLKGFFAGWGKQIRINFRNYFKYAVFLGVVAIALVAPLLFYQLRHGNELSQSLAAGRGQIQLKAKVYSARPAEYLLPNYNSYFVPNSYRHWRLVHQHGSNPSEDTLYVGLTVAALALISTLALFKPDLRKLNIKDNLSFNHLIWLLGTTTIVCFLMSLPPTVTISHHAINTPTHYIISLTAYWRVFARFFQVIDPLVIILAAAGLYVLTRKWGGVKRALLVAVCFVLLFLEYLPTPLRVINDLYKSSPTIFQTLGADKSVKVVAQYPMTDLAYAALVFTFQQVHQKAMVNPNYSPLVKSPFTQSVSGLNDPQTIGALKAEGVDVIIVSGIDMSANSQLVPYQPPDSSGVGLGASILYSYKISPSVQPLATVLAPTQGFDGSMADAKEIGHHVIHGKATMAVLMTSRQPTPADTYEASFEIISLSGKPGSITVSQSNHVLWQGVVSATTPQIISVPVTGNQPIDLTPSGPMDLLDLQATR